MYPIVVRDRRELNLFEILSCIQVLAYFVVIHAFQRFQLAYLMGLRRILLSAPSVILVQISAEIIPKKYFEERYRNYARGT